MLDLSSFSKRTMEAAQEIADAIKSGGPLTPPQEAPGGPSAPPGPSSMGPLQATASPGAPGAPGSLAVRPPGRVTPMSPLEMMPAFKSPTFASMLQGEVGRQGPVGFAQGGRVQRDLAVGGPSYDFRCR